MTKRGSSQRFPGDQMRKAPLTPLRRPLKSLAEQEPLLALMVGPSGEYLKRRSKKPK